MTTTLTTVTLDAVELAAVPPSKAEAIRAIFLPMAARVQEFEGDYNEIVQAAAEGVTPDISKRARRLRLDIARVRIDAEAARKEAKDASLREGKAIDGASNVLKWAIVDKEEALQAIENHAAKLEEERLAALHSERADALLPYVETVPDIDFSAMNDDVWAAYFSTKKRDYEERVEAEQAAEIARVALAEANARHIARSALVAPVFDFFHTDADLGLMPDAEFDTLLDEATEAKAAHLAEQEKVRAENERLAAEAQKAEAERQKELARIEAERRKDRDRVAAEAKAVEEKRQAELAAIEAERRKEREAVAAERVRLVELEAAETERQRQAEIEAKRKAEAEANAAKAPVRKRLTAWVQTFALPDLPGEDHEKAAEIRAKFQAFRKWAETEIAAI